MYIRDFLDQQIKKTVNVLYSVEVGTIVIEHPAEESHGDYSTNVAFVLSKNLGRSPYKISEELSNELMALEMSFDLDGVKTLLFSKIESVAPGFINLTINDAWTNIVLLCESQLGTECVLPYYGFDKPYQGRNVIVEYTDPNPFKVFHIGHLMSNCIGESVAKILEFNGATLKRANYQGDVGMHVAMSIWGIKKLLLEDNKKFSSLEAFPLFDRVSYMGKGYALGATAYKLEEDTVTKEIQEINYLIFIAAQERLQLSSMMDYRKFLPEFPKDLYEEVKTIYEKGREWSLSYFETVYARLGTKFDLYYFESDVGEYGLKVVEKLLAQNILEKSEGAVVFKGEDYGLHTRVFINSMGLPTYEAKELGLFEKKYEDFKYDLSVVVTANEISEYFKVLLKVMSLYHPELAEKTKHLAHGLMKLPSGKMSSRTGKVVAGDLLLNNIKDVALAKMKTQSNVSVAEEQEDIADKIAVASLKYSVLKQSIGQDIIYDEEKATELTGDTGPYLLYTYARTRSILEKAGVSESFYLDPVVLAVYQPSQKEQALTKYLYRFNETADMAAQKLAPNVILEFVSEVCRRYNTFYTSCPVLAAETPEIKNYRLLLTISTSKIIATCLDLLGIPLVERM